MRYPRKPVLAEEWNRIIKVLAMTVREMRTLIGWSQQDLADRAVISQGAVSRIESGNCTEVPFHSVVVIVRALAPALRELKIELSTSAEGLLAFTKPFNGVSLTDEPINPDLVFLSRTLNGMTERQRIAFLNLMRPLAELISVSLEARLHDTQEVFLRQHQVLPVQEFQPTTGRRPERVP